MDRKALIASLSGLLAVTINSANLWGSGSQRIHSLLHHEANGEMYRIYTLYYIHFMIIFH